MVRKSKMDKAMETLLAMMTDSGVEVDTESLSIPRHNYRSNDAVVVFAHLPAHFKPGVCKECGRTFAVNKLSVGYCSDPCRDENWRRTTGLSPNVVKIHDVWYGDPPMIVTPDQYDKLKAIADWFTKSESALQVVATPQDNPNQTENQQPLKELVSAFVMEEASGEVHTNLEPLLNSSIEEQKFPEVEPFGFL